MNENLPLNERPTNRHLASNSTLWIGLILLIVGGILLMNSLGISIHVPFNWWAIFILIPAVHALRRGMAMLNEARIQGQPLTHYGRSHLVLGAILLIVTFILMFNLNWGLLWPALLIAGGVSLLYASVSR